RRRGPRHHRQDAGPGSLDPVPMKSSMRAAVASVTAAAFLLAGCSKAVRVPNETLRPSTEWKGLHRVTTKTDHYTTRYFSITDSTLVITKLGGSDDHYGIAKLPLTIPLADVQSVEKLEDNPTNTGLVVVGALVLGAFIYFVSTFRVNI